MVCHLDFLIARVGTERVVEDGEFSRLAAEASDLWLRTFLELAYSYGWRKGELLGLRVRQIDLRLRTIRLDVGSTKNGEGREVAMTSKVEELLRQAIGEGSRRLRANTSRREAGQRLSEDMAKPLHARRPADTDSA